MSLSTRELVGTIRDVDIEFCKGGSVGVILSSATDQRGFPGKLFGPNRFQLILPSDVADSEIKEIQVWGYKQLAIESRDPWVLRAARSAATPIN